MSGFKDYGSTTKLSSIHWHKRKQVGDCLALVDDKMSCRQLAEVHLYI